MQYPQLDSDHKIHALDDANYTALDSKTAEAAKLYLGIFSLITQVYPSKFDKDNPSRNVIINMIDPSYRLIAARSNPFAGEPDFSNAYGKITGLVHIGTPSAKERIAHLSGR